MIELRDVWFEYPQGNFSLNVPELTIDRQARAAAIGPSGSGKTTLLNLISGIDIPSSGRVSTAGASVERMSPAARRAFRITHIGFVFQSFLLLDYLNVFDNILYPYRLHSDLKLDREARARAEQLADTLGIAAHLGRHPQHLSQGERQRVAIARALVTEPKLLLADEPTGNLDPAAKKQVVDLLIKQSEARAMTLLMVTHDHSLLDRFDQVIDVAEFGRTEAA